MKCMAWLFVVACLAATTLDFRAAAQASAEQSATKQQATASSPDDKSGPNYADTVHYIQQKIGDAGYPTPGGKLYGVVGNSPGVADTFNYDDAKYTFNTDGCQSMTISSTVGAHMRDYSNEDRSWHNKDGQMVTSFTVPFRSVGTYSTSAGDVPAVFSTHEPVTNAATGALFSDGYPIGPVLDLMISQLPPTQAIERGDATDHQDWHDGVWIVPKDLGVSWSNSDNSGDEPTNQSGNFTKSGIPILMIRFVEPGKGATSAHVAKAIQHLVDFCVKHSDQGPKELF